MQRNMQQAVSNLKMKLKQRCMAERQGFEPWVGLHPQRFSRPPRSTAPAPLREAGRAGYLRSLSGARHFGTAVVLEEPRAGSSETRCARMGRWPKKPVTWAFRTPFGRKYASGSDMFLLRGWQRLAHRFRGARFLKLCGEARRVGKPLRLLDGVFTAQSCRMRRTRADVPRLSRSGFRSCQPALRPDRTWPSAGGSPFGSGCIGNLNFERGA